MLLFLAGQTLASLGCALMVALDWGADAYNIIVQGLSARSGYAHGTMSSLLQLILLLLCIPWGRRRIGPGTLICVVLVGVVINLTAPLLAPAAAAALPARLLLALLVPTAIGAGVAMVQAADIGMSSNDLLPLLLYERQHRLQFRTVRILYDAAQCLLGLAMGGRLGPCSVITIALTGPSIQFFLGLRHKAKR